MMERSNPVARLIYRLFPHNKNKKNIWVTCCLFHFCTVSDNSFWVSHVLFCNSFLLGSKKWLTMHFVKPCSPESQQVISCSAPLVSQRGYFWTKNPVNNHKARTNHSRSVFLQLPCGGLKPAVDKSRCAYSVLWRSSEYITGLHKC